jgi:hypothetical protein
MRLLTAPSTARGDLTANEWRVNLDLTMKVNVQVHVLVTKPAGRTLGQLESRVAKPHNLEQVKDLQKPPDSTLTQ